MIGRRTLRSEVVTADDDRLTNVVGALSLAISDRIRDVTETVAGMSGAGPVALVALHQFLTGQTTEQLARVTGLTHSGAVRLVDRLVGAGLAERRSGHDGRSLSIVLTPAGRALSRRLTDARAAAIAAVLAPLGREERRALLALTDSMINGITELRLESRHHGVEPTGWLCRLCDLAACGRPVGACPAANSAQAWLHRADPTAE